MTPERVDVLSFQAGASKSAKNTHFIANEDKTSCSNVYQDLNKFREHVLRYFRLGFHY